MPIQVYIQDWTWSSPANKLTKKLAKIEDSVQFILGYSSSRRIRQDLIAMRKFVEKMNKERVGEMLNALFWLDRGSFPTRGVPPDFQGIQHSSQMFGFCRNLHEC